MKPKTPKLHERLEVIYEDLDLIVILKASGILSYPLREDPKADSAIKLIRRYWKIQGKSDQTLYLLHRLDQDTTGLMVFAKTSLARRSLLEQFEQHSVVRGYLAITSGVPEARSGKIETFLGRNSRGKRAVMPAGKLAITHYEVMKAAHGKALIRCNLQTGRTHQVRIHLSHLGAPVIGDRIYGSDSKGQLALFANMLGFQHPRNDRPVVFRLPRAGSAVFAANLRKAGII